MLAYFIIGVSLLLALMVGSQAIATADPKKLIKALRISAVIICAVVAGFFALTGRFPYAAPFVAAGLFFLRSKPLFSARNPSSGQQSDVETDWLQASLNHDTGEMDAMILRGRFEGRQLSSLGRAELSEFHQECAGDEQTLAILESFIARNFDEDFATEDDEHHSKEEHTRAASSGGPMTRQEALEILELDGKASTSDIKSAHRRLMKKFHPDHNGSDYMAAKLNEAKDVLLKS